MSYFGGTHTLKSASQPRVNLGVSMNQAGARMAGHYSALCSTGNPDLQNDIFGRPVGSLGVDMRGAPECDVYMPSGQSSMNHITRENLERPYVAIAPEGARGTGDLMGKGRQTMPQDLYGEGLRGNFIRWNAPSLTLPDRRQRYEMGPPIERRELNSIYPTTHDTVSEYVYRG
jgi:hypothetical protein